MNLSNLKIIIPDGGAKTCPIYGGKISNDRKALLIDYGMYLKNIPLQLYYFYCSYCCYYFIIIFIGQPKGWPMNILEVWISENVEFLEKSHIIP